MIELQTQVGKRSHISHNPELMERQNIPPQLEPEVLTAHIQDILNKTAQVAEAWRVPISDAEVSHCADKLGKVISTTLADVYQRLSLDLKQANFEIKAYDHYLTDRIIENRSSAMLNKNKIVVSVFYIRELIEAIATGDISTIIAFQSSLAHESFHDYVQKKYPVADELTSDANQADRDGDETAYYLDFGERGATLFEIEYLRSRAESGDESEVIRQECQRQSDELNTLYQSRLVDARQKKASQ